MIQKLMTNLFVPIATQTTIDVFLAKCCYIRIWLLSKNNPVTILLLSKNNPLTIKIQNYQLVRSVVNKETLSAVVTHIQQL